MSTHPSAPGVSVPAAGSHGASALPPADGTPLLSLDDCLRNTVQSLGADQAQASVRDLSSREKFFVQVAEVYQHQTLSRAAAEAEAAAKVAAGASPSVGGAAATAAAGGAGGWPFGAMEQKLLMSKFQLDNIVQTIEHLLRTEGHRGVLAAGGVPSAVAAQQQPPVLGLSERNTEMFERKMHQDAAMQSEQQRLEREHAAAGAMRDDGGESEVPPTEEEELASFLAGDELDDPSGPSGAAATGDEARMVLDASDAQVGGVSLAARRNRLGALLMMKRRQYTDAASVFARGVQSVRRSIDSDRRFLEGVRHLARYWTVRTVPADVAAATHLPASMAAAQHAQGRGAPLLNPHQLGLTAGAISPYPCLMIDYRIGTLDIALDRGKTWLYRNDAGDLFVDEGIGKEDSTTTTAAAPAAAKPATAVKQEEMKDGGADSATATAPLAPAVPSWLGVSARLHRAQHQLLYKHLYSALMLEARDLRIASHKEQQKAAAAAFNAHAVSAASSSSAAATAAAAVTPAAAIAAQASSFVPPPSMHTNRPWSVADLSPRRIRVDCTGFAEGLAIEWNEGIHAPFLVRTSRLDTPTTSAALSLDDDPEQLPKHLSQLLCHQCMLVLLEQTSKNSLSNRRLAELLGEDLTSGSCTNSNLRRDAAVAATGTGLSGTGGQEESWPARAPSMLQLLVMAVNHWRLVREVRAVVRRAQQEQQLQQQIASASSSSSSTSSSSFASAPRFRIKVARTKQPYLYAFSVFVGRRIVLEASIRGLHFSVVVRVPSKQQQSLGSKSFDASDYAVAETVLCGSAAQFADVLARALSWFKL